MERVKSMEKKEKIVLPKELQKEMFQFFLRTSIPKKKRLKLLSEKEKDERILTDERQETESK